MKISVQDIRRQYAELSDEGLLEIQRADLVEDARRCYDDELARRGLATTPVAQVSHQPPPNPEHVAVPAAIEDDELTTEALTDLSYIRHGMGAVRPYVYGSLE